MPGIPLLGGVAKGATSGIGGGPLGMIAGALAGAGTEAMALNQEKKARDRADPRPKRRRLAKIHEAVQQGLSNKQRALIAMAQAHQNFASMF